MKADPPLFSAGHGPADVYIHALHFFFIKSFFFKTTKITSSLILHTPKITSQLLGRRETLLPSRTAVTLCCSFSLPLRIAVIRLARRRVAIGGFRVSSRCGCRIALLRDSTGAGAKSYTDSLENSANSRDVALENV